VTNPYLKHGAPATVFGHCVVQGPKPGAWGAQLARVAGPQSNIDAGGEVRVSLLFTCPAARKACFRRGFWSCQWMPRATWRQDCRLRHQHQHSCHQGPLRIRPCDLEGMQSGHLGWRGNRQRCFQTPRFETNFLTSMKPESAALEIGVAALNVGTLVANFLAPPPRAGQIIGAGPRTVA